MFSSRKAEKRYKSVARVKARGGLICSHVRPGVHHGDILPQQVPGVMSVHHEALSPLLLQVRVLRLKLKIMTPMTFTDEDVS